MILLGGLNPIAATVEAGFDVDNIAESGMMEFSQLKSIWEI
jgi:repressor of nif and glnA expression